MQKECLQSIRDECKQKSINEEAMSFMMRLRARVAAGGRHFEHVSVINCLVLNLSTVILSTFQFFFILVTIRVRTFIK